MSHLRKKQCLACKQPHWFRFWIDENCASSQDGLSVSDFDLVFHRFRTVTDKKGTREIECVMFVEVKTGEERLGIAQRDTLGVVNGLLQTFVPINGSPINVQSRSAFIVKGSKKVVWLGCHLVRVPLSENSGGQFYWDNRPISRDRLAAVLSFEYDPNKPERKLDILRRHKPAAKQPLFESFSQ